MAVSKIDGTIEEVVIRRRRSQVSFYDRVKFRLDDGSTKTWTRAHIANSVGDLMVPGTRGRFYLFTAIDHRGICGVRTEAGKEAFGIAKVNEYVSIGIMVTMTLLTILNVAIFNEVRIIPLVLAILGIPMFLVYRQNRVECEKAYDADAGYRPTPRPVR
jgi:hypothetical protein